MKNLLIISGLVISTFVAASPAKADVYVDGYTRQNGTYVQPHYRSNPNGNPYDNWSTRGNVNPYTGSYGTRNPSYDNPFSNYSSPTYPSSGSYYYPRY